MDALLIYPETSDSIHDRVNTLSFIRNSAHFSLLKCELEDYCAYKSAAVYQVTLNA